MCGIIGIFNSGNAAEKAIQGLNSIKERGRESYGISNGAEIKIFKDVSEMKSLAGKNIVCHCLHSVVSYMPQPIKGESEKSILSANCEIYNWKELNEKYNLNAENDADMLLKLLGKIGVEKSLKELDGTYAFAYWLDDKLFLARDILGVKPLWYSQADSFGFASEKKALEKVGYDACFELNPRKILVYDIKSLKVSFIEREFFSLKPENKKNADTIKKEVSGLIANAIAKRIPDKKFGLLFSGGIDSSTIAMAMKNLDLDFTCYLAVLDEPGLKQAEDLEWAENAAKELGLELKIKKVRLSEVPDYLKKVVPLIEDSNVTKVGVGLTFYAACELAKEDGVKVIFSGLGSEEIFAGYDRHKKSNDINKECYSGLLKIYERDMYRDDVITMANNLELRLPFLDKALVDYALKIPAEMKIDFGNDINPGNNKLVLREIALSWGMKKEFAMRKKRAAQYGSRFDSAIEKLAKKEKFKTKSEYLRQFYPQKNMKLGVLFSSGKDSMFALYTMLKQNYEITCLISLKSKNDYSYMFHTPNIALAKLQAEALGFPLVEQETTGEKEKELSDLKEALVLAKKKYGIEGIVTGALFSNYQRERIEKLADSVGLKIFSPLWHMEQELEFRNVLDSGFKVMLSSIAADGLDKSWLGKEISHDDINKLTKLNLKIGINIAGEGGEFESLVVDGPIFSKRIKIIDSEIIEEGKNSARFVVKKAELEDKE